MRRVGGMVQLPLFAANLTDKTKASEGSTVDVAERELDRMIERRSSRESDPDEREELWQASVRAYNARQRDEMRAAWCEYHREQAARLGAVFEPLIARHEERAAKLTDEQPKGAA